MSDYSERDFKKTLEIRCMDEPNYKFEMGGISVKGVPESISLEISDDDAIDNPELITIITAEDARMIAKQLIELADAIEPTNDSTCSECHTLVNSHE